MESASVESLFEEKRQSPVAIFLFIASFLRRFIRGAWALLFFFFFGRRDGETSISAFLGFIAMIAAGLALVMSVLRYFRYYYSVDEDSLNIREGVLSKKNLNLPFDRIQNINFEQKIVHRFFNVVALQIDTAGSVGNELRIDALPREEAEAIRDYILAKKREIIAEQRTETEEGEEGEVKALPEEEVFEQDELLLHLNPFDLLKVGISQNHIRTAAIIFGFAFTFTDNITELFGFDIYDYIEENAEGIAAGFLMKFIVFVGVTLVAVLGLSMFRTVLQYFNLSFYKSRDGFRLTSGLITKQEVALRKEKVQIIAWSNNPIRKLFGIYTLMIKQASAGVVANRRQAANIPGCYDEQIKEVLSSCFPDMTDDEFKEHDIHRSLMIRRFIYLGILPTIALVGLFLLTYSIQTGVAMVVYPMLVFFLLYRYQRNFKWYVGQEYIKTERGIFGRTYSVAPYYKVQTVEIVQTPFQRKRDLGNVTIYTAGGSLSIPYMEMDKARELRDYILYRVETSKRSWM